MPDPQPPDPDGDEDDDSEPEHRSGPLTAEDAEAFVEKEVG